MSNADLQEQIPMIPPYRVISRVQILAETKDYNHEMMNVPTMWKETMGAGIKVVVLDTGVPNHVDLKPDENSKSFIDGYKEDQSGHGCVSPNTLIHTNFCGVEAIEELYSRVGVPEQTWKSPDGSKSVVKDVRGQGIKTFSFDVKRGKTVVGDIEFLHRTPVSGEVVSVDIEGGGRMVLTPWHPIPLQRRNSHGDKYYEKVRADSLVEGDHLIAPSTDEWISDRVFSFNGTLKWKCKNCGHAHTQKREHKEGSEHRCSQCGKRNVLESFTPSYRVTDDLAYLMGLIFTDGSITRTTKGTTITVASKDHELTDVASEISERAGFGGGSYYDRGVVRIWRNHGKDFFTFLCNAGFVPGREKKKTLPQFIGKSTREVACAFVAGLIDGDGYIGAGKGTRSNIMVSTKDVAERLRVLLNTLGMRTSVFVAPGTTFGSKNKHRTGRDMYYCRFTRIIPVVVKNMKHPVRKKRAASVERLYQRGVYRIKKTSMEEYDGFFYDFTVKDAHTYLANGVFTSNTHVGGIIAGIAGNSMGVAGIAPESEDFYGAVLGANGGGSIQGIIDGIRWAVDEVGANVINMSLGIPDGSPTIKELEKACNYARNKGVAVICAAGNEASGVGQPARYDSCIAVAAVNNKKEQAWFSNTGPEVDFATGGVDVYSTYLNNGYAKLSGTSMASPSLAGIAVLIMADELKDNDKLLTPDELVVKMKKIAYDVGEEGFDEIYGHGIPIFRSSGEPEEPEEPEQPDEPDNDDSDSPCRLGLPMARAFVDGTVSELSKNNGLEDSMAKGFKELQKFLRRVEANQKSR